jgi:hypothetical protein
MDFKTRKYRFKGANTGNEMKQFWLFALIGLALGAAILYFF